MAVLDHSHLVDWQPTRWRIRTRLRYAGVFAVWLVLLAINPPLAWDVFRNRRADSPIPRLALRRPLILASDART